MSKILESGEMYLENILMLRDQLEFVRAIDVVKSTGYSKPSISRAVGLLKAGGYVTADREGHLSLTESGRSVAQKIYERHTILTRFLTTLGVDEETASEDACKLEHAISDTSFEAIKRFASEQKK